MLRQVDTFLFQVASVDKMGLCFSFWERPSGYTVLPSEVKRFPFQNYASSSPFCLRNKNGKLFLLNALDWASVLLVISGCYLTPPLFPPHVLKALVGWRVDFELPDLGIQKWLTIFFVNQYYLYFYLFIERHLTPYFILPYKKSWDVMILLIFSHLNAF